MSAPKSVIRLVNHFGNYERDYIAASYNEALTRQEFINPLFEALGWDVANRRLAPPDAREVIHEDQLLIEGTVKAPDYTFRLKKRRRFFVEAKKPSVSVATGRPAAYQVRRYGWSANMPFSIVTDFQEFAVYDCRDLPQVGDSATTARLRYFTFRDYDAEWSWLEDHFSRPAVEGGSLERLARVGPTRTARAIDTAFLAEIQDWRQLLADDINRRNTLSLSELNAAVQVLIDRVVFLRIAEARGLEPNDQLQRIRGDGHNIYARLMALFVRADDRYNSGLFHFRSERGRGSEPDLTATHLQVGDPVLNHVLGRLYYPQPYEFSVLPADILGQVYERFLGQAIELDRSGAASVVDKPEVRKAGGVYYTPQSVVEYIVESTLAPMLRHKTPQEVARLKVLDPACGSGSFLITAYQYLLDWHVEYYLKGTRKDRQHLESDAAGQPRLKADLRRRILTNNIWGVDLDPSAVEVAKLSLLLKVIEGQQQLEFEVGRLLPDLDDNVKNGNALIGLDYRGSQVDAVAPLDFRVAFPEIMADGGWDAVIGNPPYFSIDATWGAGDDRAQYLKQHYPDIYTDKTDVLYYFLARATELSRGEVAMIVSRSMLEGNKAQLLRKHLASKMRVREVLDFQHAHVFPGVGINTAILRLTTARRVLDARVRRFQPRALPPGVDSDGLKADALFESFAVAQDRFGGGAWNFADTDVDVLLQAMDVAGRKVGEILAIGQGMQTGRNDAFTIPAHLQDELDRYDAYVYQRARNSDVGPYELRDSGVWLIYPERALTLSGLPAPLRRHLEGHRSALEGRAAFKRGNCEWWRYTWPLHKERIDRARLISPYMARETVSR